MKLVYDSFWLLANIIGDVLNLRSFEGVLLHIDHHLDISINNHIHLVIFVPCRENPLSFAPEFITDHLASIV